jgi:hypothetical protein
MKYKLVFDVVQEGYRNWGFLVPGLIFIVIGIGMLVHRWKFPAKDTKFSARIFPYFFAGFAILWTATSFWGTFSEYFKLKQAVLNGKYEVIEGTITDFVPMPSGGHAKEHFKVNGHYYEYSNFNVIAGFNKTQAYGGPLRGGMPVRIAEVDGQIARLEIIEADNESKPNSAPEVTPKAVAPAPFNNFRILFAGSFGWIAFLIMASVIYRYKKGKSLPAIDPVAVLYRESGASGSSHKNFLTRLGGARGCLVVTATSHEIDVRPHFPFNLMFLPEIYDLQYRISVQQIRNIERVKHWIGKDSIKIDFIENDGNNKTIELYLSNTDKFLDSIGWKVV